MLKPCFKIKCKSQKIGPNTPSLFKTNADFKSNSSDDVLFAFLVNRKFVDIIIWSHTKIFKIRMQLHLSLFFAVVDFIAKFNSV